MDRGGLVDWETNSTGAPREDSATVATAEQPAVRQYGPDDSALDVYFDGQPFNRADVVMVAAIVSALIMAFSES